MKAHQHRDRPPAQYSTGEDSHPAVLPGILASLAGLVLFAIIAEAVVHLDRITEWDIRALQWLHSGTSPLGIEFFTAVSLFGAPLFLGCLGLIVAVFLIRKQQWNYLAGWCVALIGGETLESVLKLLIQRPRPENAASSLAHFTYSLPSGHAMTSMIAYIMLSYVLVTIWKPGRTWRIGIVATATLLLIGIGFSRVYLGVHYVSDVVAGFAGGTFWVFLCISATIFLQNRSNAGAERKP
jgi:undecaprenyl-diphosphatase